MWSRTRCTWNSISQRKLKKILQQTPEVRKYTRRNPFCDKWKALVSSGRGGDGRSAFLHLMNTEFAGPTGGNGGRGGHVYLVATQKRQDLGHLRNFGYHIQATQGANGDTKDMVGSSGKDLLLDVPLGTVVLDLDNNEVVHDLDREGGVLLLEGGRGGKGNAAFAHATNHAPRECTRGLPGNSILAQFELKTLADVALVGYPNAGKSSFLGMITTCRPKVAAYAFTTLYPMVGNIHNELGDSIAIADLPGLIEGSFANRGLGHQFLRHVERSRCLVYVLDMYESYLPNDRTVSQNPSEVLFALQMELEYYMPGLSDRAIMVLANKMDRIPEKAHGEVVTHPIEELRASTHLPVYPISCLTTDGIREAVDQMFSLTVTRNKTITTKRGQAEHQLAGEVQDRVAARQTWLRGRATEQREVWSASHLFPEGHPSTPGLRPEKANMWYTRSDVDGSLQAPFPQDVQNDIQGSSDHQEPEQVSLVDQQVLSAERLRPGHSVVTNTTQYINPPHRFLTKDPTLHGHIWRQTREDGERLPDEKLLWFQGGGGGSAERNECRKPTR